LVAPGAVGVPGQLGVLPLRPAQVGAQHAVPEDGDVLGGERRLQRGDDVRRRHARTCACPASQAPMLASSWASPGAARRTSSARAAAALRSALRSAARALDSLPGAVAVGAGAGVAVPVLVPGT